MKTIMVFTFMLLLPSMGFASTQPAVLKDPIPSHTRSKYDPESFKNKRPSSKPEVVYLYGYTSTELRSVPRKIRSRSTDLSSIPEHEAWSFLFDLNASRFDKGPEKAWYLLNKAAPTLKREKLNSLITIGRATKAQESTINNAAKDNERQMCFSIYNAVKSGQKLNNAQVKQMISEQQQKVPELYAKAVQKIQNLLSPKAFAELSHYVNNDIRKGISLSELDIEGWAKLRDHQYTYSDIYEAIICRDYLN